MIFDLAENLSLYKNILPNLEKGLAEIKKFGDNFAVGKYEFDGGYFMVQEGETRSAEDGDYEAHRKYLDAQIMLDGEELVVWQDISKLKTVDPYSEKTDKEMLNGETGTTFVAKKGMAWVAFPNDAHKACRDNGRSGRYKKIVLKIPI